jgi:hypothetical protein
VKRPRKSVNDCEPNSPNPKKSLAAVRMLKRDSAADGHQRAGRRQAVLELLSVPALPVHDARLMAILSY